MQFDLESLVRENVKKLVPYSSARSEYGGGAHVFLDANENALGSPPGPRYNRYPDPLQGRLKGLIAEEIALTPSQIFVGNGSDEAIDLLVRIFCVPGVDNVLICSPTYGMYEVAAALNDVRVIRVDLSHEFKLDTVGVFQAVNENTKLIFLCSPNNPTGNLLDRASILDLVRGFSGVVVVDEAYLHYSGEASLVGELCEHPNLVVLQTFAKAWGLAGLRVGLAFASQEIIGLFNKVKPPYNVSQIAQDLVAEAFQDQAGLRSAVERTLSERLKLRTSLTHLRSVETVFPSDANFLLIKVADADELYDFLLSKGIVVRKVKKIGRGNSHMRITVGTPAENQALLNALKEYETSLVY